MEDQICTRHCQAELERGSSHQPRVLLSQVYVCDYDEQTSCRRQRIRNFDCHVVHRVVVRSEGHPGVGRAWKVRCHRCQ